MGRLQREKGIGGKLHLNSINKISHMKYELRSKKWFISKDDRIVQGLITKREMLETDDHNEGKSNLRRYYLRTDWQGPEWVNEDDLFDSPSALVEALSIPCNFE